MADPDTRSGPAPMEGHGFYNRSSRVQAGGLSPAVASLEAAAQAAALPAQSQAIVIADYGSSEGRNSLVPIAAAIKVLRQRAGRGRAVSVVHTDLPGNDFGALFRTLDEDPDSYLRNDPAVFASAVGRSFYEPLLPAGSVVLGWSSWAVQWLSRTPASVPDHIQAACSRDAAVRAAYARQAAEDWRLFLTCRAGELRRGGRLVVLTMGLTDTGAFGYHSVLEAMYRALMDLVAEGFVSGAEADRMSVPTVGRDRADLLAPFAGNGCFDGLSAERVDVFLEEDRIWGDYRRDNDARAFGARWAAFSRASIFPTLALSLDGGDERRRAEFVARLETRMAARLSENPEPNEIPLASIVIAKDRKP